MTGDPPSAEPADGDGALLAQAGVLPALDQAFDSGTLYALRSAVQAHAFAAGMPEYRADDVVIAIHELAANVVQHGAGRGRLRMWQVPGALQFQVDEGSVDEGGVNEGSVDEGGVDEGGVDEGRAVASADGHGGNAADHWPYIKGHGLWLVREVADQMSMFSGGGGTRATVLFALPR
jgi:anti-sigma regulatory factor (Ser/Thr protein kinase)